MNRVWLLALCCLALGTSCAPAGDAAPARDAAPAKEYRAEAPREWGTLEGRFVYDGEAPAPVALGGLPPECAANKPVNESLLVDEKGGVANVVVFLQGEPPAVHPDYAKTANDEVTLKIVKCRFEPHVLLVRTTQTLVIENQDGFGYNPNIMLVRNDPLNFLLRAGQSAKVTLPQEETRLCNLSGNVHPWLHGRILVRSNPYMAASDDKGNFEIKNLPTGTELEFQLLHENPGVLKNVAIKDAAAGKSDAKGRFKLKVAAAGTDQGDIKLSPALMQKK